MDSIKDSVVWVIFCCCWWGHFLKSVFPWKLPHMLTVCFTHVPCYSHSRTMPRLFVSVWYSRVFVSVYKHLKKRSRYPLSCYVYCKLKFILHLHNASLQCSLHDRITCKERWTGVSGPCTPCLFHPLVGHWHLGTLWRCELPSKRVFITVCFYTNPVEPKTADYIWVRCMVLWVTGPGRQCRLQSPRLFQSLHLIQFQYTWSSLNACSSCSSHACSLCSCAMLLMC